MVNVRSLRLAVFATVGSLGLVLAQPPVAEFIRQSFGALVLGLLAWLAATLWRTESRGWVRRLALVCLGLALVTLFSASSGWFVALQAWAAQALFAFVHVLMVALSSRWLKGPIPVEDGGFPSLRSLSRFAVGIVLVQVALGAGYRHGLTGLPLHVLGAVLVTTVLLVLASFTIVQFPNHAPLTRAAWVVIGAVTVQIALGIIAYIGRAGQPEGIDPSMPFRASTIAHIAFAALTLAATTGLASLVHYHVRPRTALQPGFRAVS